MRTWAIHLLATVGSMAICACAYDLDLEGKRCDDAHPCPAGYACTGPAGSTTCQARAGDGGSVDADGGGGDCLEDETRCTPDGRILQTCDRSGTWISESCQSGTYCLDVADGPDSCVSECLSSTQCPTDHYCNPANKHCEPRGTCGPPDSRRCNLTFDAVLICDAESGTERVDEQCDDYCDPADATCKHYCQDDTDCPDSPLTSCDRTTLVRKCVSAGLCESSDQCPAEGGVCAQTQTLGCCVLEPLDEGQLFDGSPPSLACFVGTPSSPPDTPVSCQVDGRVVSFYSMAQDIIDAEPLPVRFHRLSDILDGNLDRPLQAVLAQPDAENRLRFSATVPTNTEMVVEIQARLSGEFPFAGMFTFGIYLRADECQDAAGRLPLIVPAIYASNYDSYANPEGTGIVANADKGLVFGRLLDCDGGRIAFGTGAVSMPRDLLYYIDEQSKPDPVADSTGHNGFFVAVNARPIRGIAAALVKSGTTVWSLRSRWFRVFPEAASMVIFEPLKNPIKRNGDGRF